MTGPFELKVTPREMIIKNGDKIIIKNKRHTLFYISLILEHTLRSHNLVILETEYHEALMREIKEECGLEVEILANRLNRNDPNHKHLFTPSYLNIHKVGDKPNEVHKHVGLIYFARAKSDKFKLAEDEHDDIRWFDAEKLNDQKYNILPIVQFYAKEALKRASEHD